MYHACPIDHPHSRLPPHASGPGRCPGVGATDDRQTFPLRNVREKGEPDNQTPSEIALVCPELAVLFEKMALRAGRATGLVRSPESVQDQEESSAEQRCSSREESVAKELVPYALDEGSTSEAARVQGWRWQQDGDDWVKTGPCPRCQHVISKRLVMTSYKKGSGWKTHRL